MGMKPKGRECCVEFRVYVDEKLKSNFLSSIAHTGICRHQVFESLMIEWIEQTRESFLVKHREEQHDPRRQETA